MKYTLNNKTINIPDVEIEKSMKVLELTKEEAIQMWLEDEGYLDNDEQMELVQKKVKVVGESDKKRSSKPKVIKVSDEKKELFSEIFTDLYDVFGENAKIVKENKLISVEINDRTFKIDIIEQRKPKN